jgi:hypothetical protein
MVFLSVTENHYQAVNQTQCWLVVMQGRGILSQGFSRRRSSSEDRSCGSGAENDRRSPVVG